MWDRSSGDESGDAIGREEGEQALPSDTCCLDGKLGGEANG